MELRVNKIHIQRMSRKNSLTEFIAKAKEVHKGENLDYSKVEYINNRTPVCIISHDIAPNGEEYGEFWQTPSNHLKGQSHPLKKGEKISREKSLKQEEIIKRFKEVHKGEDLDYSKVEYRGMHKRVCIIDPIYGEYWQEPIVHLKGCGHPKRKASRTKLTTDKFVEKAECIHKEKYDYSVTNCNGYRSIVKIVCPIHGEFEQTAENHLAGKGCPKCGVIESRAEDEIRAFLSTIVPETDIIMHDRQVLGNGKELDIYIPSHNLAIEYDGLVWHSERFKPDRKYHLEKTELCEEKGIRLIHLFEDEWEGKRVIVEKKLKHILGGDERLTCIGARKCKIQEIEKKDAFDFLEKNHIQGFASASIYLGGYFDNQLVAVMGFVKSGINEWELNRFATNPDLRLPGVASKLFCYFAQHYNPVKIKSFLDRRWNNSGNTVYERLGFHVDEIEKPDYQYVVNNGHKRAHKFGFRKAILAKKYGFPMEMTESEMAKAAGFDRIWNCGLVKYVWQKSSDGTI